MKRVLTVFSVSFLLTAIAFPANGWEFSLTGEMESRYRYFARTGPADLFGMANPLAVGYNNGAIGLAGYYGGANQVYAQGFSAKGSDAASNDYRIWLYPELRVNSAIRLRAEYWVTGGNVRGSYDGPGYGPYGGVTGGPYPTNPWFVNRGQQGWYQNPAPTGLKNGMGTGLWEKFWLTAHTPWGILVLGRRGMEFGLGWSMAHQQDSDGEMLGLVVPYGPFRFLFFQQLYDNNWINPNASQVLTASSSVTGGFFPAALAAPTDQNGTRDINGGAGFTYTSGNLDAGTYARYVFYRNVHSYSLSSPGAAPVPAGPHGADDASNSIVPAFFSGPGLSGAPTVSDVDIWLQDYYVKYTNGRLFFNAEYVMNVVDVFRKGGRPIAGWQDAWMIEMGVTSGPAKLSLAHFYRSGHDRRGGYLNTTAPLGRTSMGAYVMDRYDEFMVFGGSNFPIKPYNLLFGLYGCGNNGYDARGLAWYTDFLAYAARLDYAVAANLNVFGTFMHANRASKTSTAIGQYRGGVSNATYRIHPGYNNTGTVQTAAIPNVPDTNLGWEADVGVDWKLLENMTLHALFAYWRPGEWFKWAYVDYSNGGTTTVGGRAYPVNPHRDIDPLIAIQTSLVVDF